MLRNEAPLKTNAAPFEGSETPKPRVKEIEATVPRSPNLEKPAIGTNQQSSHANARLDLKKAQSYATLLWPGRLAQW